MKKLLLPVFIFCAFSASAQLNNSWIDYSKTYYKFKVAADNICRISQPVLNGTAAALGSANADHFQLWRNGKEVRLYTSVSGAVFGASDYIEFFGEMNDGKADAQLYNQPQLQFADKWSLETDTATYFLTVNPAGGNLRYSNINNPSPGAAAPDAFFMRNVDIYYKDILNHGFGKDLGEYVYSSAYDEGECYTTNNITAPIGSPVTFVQNFTGLNVYPAGSPTYRFRFKGYGNTDNNQRTTTVKFFNTTVLTKSTYATQGIVTSPDITRPISDLSDPTNLTVNVINTNNGIITNDNIVIATMGITYPATFNFNNQKSFYFELAASPSGNNLVIDNFNYGSTAPILYDINNGRRYIGDITSTPGKVKFVLPASSEVLRKFLLNNIETSNINPITSLTSKTFIDFNTAATRGDYIIISNPLLYNDGNGVNFVEQYRQYRSTANGGGYTAKVADIAELSDQFGFGIKNHPGAVRDFVRFMDLQYPVKPKYIFLIGRGLSYFDAKPYESNPASKLLDLVPTFGWPASDVLIVSKPGQQVAITPVGRIAAVTGTEVGSYLQKVIQYETAQRTQSPLIADKAWMKNTMQIVGGADPDQQHQFDLYCDVYADTMRRPKFGGKNVRFDKTSVATIQQASSQQITQLFAEGLGFIQYFGHSSASTFEFNLASPELFENTGKYPFFNVSGCSAGNFFNFDPTRLMGQMGLSERYILYPNKGSIGFLADTHFGIPYVLDEFNQRFHTDFSGTMYGETVGNQMKDVQIAMGGTAPSVDYYRRIHIEEINLHGDAAIRINSFPKPDYVIENQLLKITPSIISVADPSFHVKVNMQNIGRAINDSFRVLIQRTLPGATVPVTIKDTLIKATLFSDSLEFNVPINQLTDKGDNKISVELDWTNKIPEIYETNNKVSQTFTIFEDELRPVYPYNFAILNAQNTIFSASTANPLVGTRNYVMEIDTTESFNSPFKKTYNATGIGGLIQFAPSNLIYADSTSYYWRTAVVPSPGNNIIWNNSSFVYLPAGTPGYNQSHYFQHLKSTSTQVALKPDRSWKFDTYNSIVSVRNGVFPSAASTAQDFAVDIDGAGNILSVCGISGIILVAINPVGMVPLKNTVYNGPPSPAGLYGSDPVCGTNRQYQFQYNILSQAGRDAASNFLRNVVPNGWYVVVRNISGTDPASNTYAPTWAADPGPNSMYLVLKNAGFLTIDQFTSPLAFNFIYKKGDPSYAPVTKFSAGITDKIESLVTLAASKGDGEIVSPVFGPAASWTGFHWRGKSVESPTADSLAFKVIGITPAGIENVLYTVDSTVKDLNIAAVNAAQYPYIKLKMYNRDTVNATPYQLRYWRLNYTPVPEGAIAPNLLFTMKDTVEAGDPISFSVAFKNVTPQPFTSLMKINMKIKTATNFDSVVNIPPARILLASPDTIIAKYSIPSEKYQGNNTLFVEFNPNNDQPEQSHFNNFLYKDFYVKNDPFNPLMDVTFDGVHILSRDIVSSKPGILIKLKDESRFLALKDTSLLKLQLRYPDQSLHNYYFNGDTMRFNPANLTAGENAATVDFKPYLPEDGEYELIVSGKDVSGNSAGNLNYHTVFTVINKPMISEMLNYPNPFTTSTAFVFTLTGSKVPQNLRIQILTITGKVVREVKKDELGPIHIGRNITEFKWDGTDMYGQKLANGVYIYRVITNLEGKSLDKYKAEGDNTDKYFNKGYGKMYLMR